MDTGIISKCELISEEKANELKDKWKFNMELARLRDNMRIKLETMTFEQLKKVEQI